MSTRKYVANKQSNHSSGVYTVTLDTILSTRYQEKTAGMQSQTSAEHAFRIVK